MIHQQPAGCPARKETQHERGRAKEQPQAQTAKKAPRDEKAHGGKEIEGMKIRASF